MTADSTVTEIEAAGSLSQVRFMTTKAEAMVTRVVQEWGRRDILVTNPGDCASTLDPALLQLITENKPAIFNRRACSR
jgi:hypothetical protein